MFSGSEPVPPSGVVECAKVGCPGQALRR
jgi:hypothetical protein